MESDRQERQASPHAGVVVRLDGAQATVRFVRGKMCEHCGACISVGDKELEMTVANTLHASVGDRVEVNLAPKRIVQASLLAYAIPLALLLIGVWLGSLRSDLAALICGVAGCGLGYFVLRLVETRGGAKTRFSPEMSAILLPEDETEPVEERMQSSGESE